MSVYKLTYFNAKGMGEPIRMMLAHMGKDFEDNRIKTGQWSEFNKTLKWGRLPVLDIDGRRHYQAQAIMRLLAKDVGLAGDDVNEAYKIDSIAGTIADLISSCSPLWNIRDSQQRADFAEKLKLDTIPYYIDQYEEIAASNGGYLANGKLSWADLFFHGWVETLEATIRTEIVNNRPNLKLGREKVQSTPGIKDWIKRRPETK